MTQRNPLDRSVAFTALLELRPGFGQTESKAASVLVDEFLEDFYASGSKDMGAWARTWQPRPPVVVPTHMVVNARDGYVCAYDHEGRPLTEETAREVAARRNADADVLPGRATYAVYSLTEVPVTPVTGQREPTECTAAGSHIHGSACYPPVASS
jgi:hypothetical protein